eukprot:9240109-Pyramimonas_sp.AAC.1
MLLLATTRLLHVLHHILGSHAFGVGLGCEDSQAKVFLHVLDWQIRRTIGFEDGDLFPVWEVNARGAILRA